MFRNGQRKSLLRKKKKHFIGATRFGYYRSSWEVKCRVGFNEQHYKLPT